MSLPAATVRFPHQRVLLHRTRLAYVHLRNLLTDAKRDRSAKVFAYVCVWLPEEFLVFFLQDGELVNVTASMDGARFHTLALSEAIAKVPREAEYGDICFHEADDEQLATMYWSQVLEGVSWPADVNTSDAKGVLGFLNATMHDGVVEVQHDEGRNYGVVRQGKIVRGFFADERPIAAEMHISQLLAPSPRWTRARLWPVPPPLPVQASPALITAYRDLMRATVNKLVEMGTESAPVVAEHARRQLASQHPALDRMLLTQPAASPSSGSTLSGKSLAGAMVRDPIAEAPALSAAVGAWMRELLWASPPGDGTTPERLISELTRDRRHMFQMAGFYDALPWKAEQR